MPDDHLLEILNRHSGRSPEGGAPDADEWLLPSDTDTYLAHGRGTHRPAFTLHCVLGKEGFRSFQYAHLDSDSRFEVAGNEQVIRLRFCNYKIAAVTIRGRNLGKLYDYLHQHRMPWIRRVDPGRDFASDGEPVISAIEIVEVDDAKPSS